jgi:hypothetical protein
MNQQTEKSANEAVFQLQFSTRDAVSYVIRNAKVNHETARQAVQHVVTFHRH